MVIGIIGAGASGMSAALEASKNEQAKILLFERQSRVGRKLQATGNGRCNLTNLNCDLKHFHGEDASFSQYALSKYDVDHTRVWFENMGLYMVAEPSGRVYPYSDQGNSVVDVLRFALQKDNIDLICGFEVKRVRREGNGFRIEGESNSYFCDKLIVACGGLAGTRLGGSMCGYQLLRSLGHRVTKLRPNLVQLQSDWKGCIALKGVRANCHAQLLHDGNCVNESVGEIQFTEFGISGPVVFEISRDACHEKGEWVCRLDFLPDISTDALLGFMKERKNRNWTTDELFTGILHNRLGRVLTQTAGIRSGLPVSQLNDFELLKAAETAKTLEITLKEPMGMDHAQVTAGGILTTEFCDRTMESKLVPGLFACGEVLDIDGDCGGYNLQWAWSSGRLAGLNAGEML